MKLILSYESVSRLEEAHVLLQKKDVVSFCILFFFLEIKCGQLCYQQLEFLKTDSLHSLGSFDHMISLHANAQEDLSCRCGNADMFNRRAFSKGLDLGSYQDH